MICLEFKYQVICVPLNPAPDLKVDSQVEGGEAREGHDVHHHQVHPRDVYTVGRGEEGVLYTFNAAEVRLASL